ncbi:MAG: hypothetical protein ACREIH_04560 [Nitrospiraceae bacterium]
MAAIVLDNHEQLAGVVKQKCVPWRRMIIGIDGVDGVGKSWLARFLSWKLEMPTIETDLYLKGTGRYELWTDDIRRIVQKRLSDNRPLIIEGAFLLQTLQALDIQHEILIYVRSQRRDDGGLDGLLTYSTNFAPIKAAHFVFVRS